MKPGNYGTQGTVVFSSDRSPSRSSTPTPKRSSSPTPNNNPRPLSPLRQVGTAIPSRDLQQAGEVSIGARNVDYDRLVFDLHIAWQTGREMSSECRWLRRSMLDEQRYHSSKIKQMEKDLQFEISNLKRQHELHLKEVREQAQRDIKLSREERRKTSKLTGSGNKQLPSK